MLFFFFFQAEDGIRDADVTGVQTCALPISSNQYRGHPTLLVVAYGRWRRYQKKRWNQTVAALYERGFFRNRCNTGGHRSEERRVGEEGRSRWSPYHLKKKKIQ